MMNSIVTWPWKTEVEKPGWVRIGKEEQKPRGYGSEDEIESEAARPMGSKLRSQRYDLDLEE